MPQPREVLPVQLRSQLPVLGLRSPRLAVVDVRPGRAAQRGVEPLEWTPEPELDWPDAYACAS
jgi:hypothetical protein